jgi:uncharacterized protein YbjT (DUF2867 family)
MAFQLILTGATGMVGEGVLLECLQQPAVARVLMVNRKPFGLQHPKLQELIVPDFMELDAFTAQLTGYDACFFCAGISSVGLNEAEYTHITYEITLHFAGVLARLNPQMVFGFISGAQTDSTEAGKVMWARVKGSTENALLRLPFRAVYNFRPGFMKPVDGQRNVRSYYRIVTWLYPLAVRLFPNHGCTLSELALAMIHSVLSGAPRHVLEVKDIKALARA